MQNPLTAPVSLLLPRLIGVGFIGFALLGFLTCFLGLRDLVVGHLPANDPGGNNEVMVVPVLLTIASFLWLYGSRLLRPYPVSKRSFFAAGGWLGVAIAYGATAVALIVVAIRGETTASTTTFVVEIAVATAVSAESMRRTRRAVGHLHRPSASHLD